MSKNRIKVRVPSILTRVEAETAVNEISLAANNRRKFIAKMDAEILAIQERYQGSILTCDTAIQEKAQALEVWATTNPDEFPKGKKSIAFLTGTLGFRTGTPKLALLSRAWNWDKVLEAIQARAFAFIRNTPEVDKEAILAFAAADADKAALEAKVLKPIGVKVTQTEAFFVEPNLTDTEVQS
jgi:phage host-nuclease inhibitor protein Gam